MWHVDDPAWITKPPYSEWIEGFRPAIKNLVRGWTSDAVDDLLASVWLAKKPGDFRISSEDDEPVGEDLLEKFRAYFRAAARFGAWKAARIRASSLLPSDEELLAVKREGMVYEGEGDRLIRDFCAAMDLIPEECRKYLQDYYLFNRKMESAFNEHVGRYFVPNQTNDQNSTTGRARYHAARRFLKKLAEPLKRIIIEHGICYPGDIHDPDIQKKETMARATELLIALLEIDLRMREQSKRNSY